MEPFERKGQTCAVPEQPLDARAVLSRDANGGVDAEPSGALPAEHAVSVGFIEQALGAKVPKYTALDDMLEIEPVGRRELAGGMELCAPIARSRKHSVEYHEVVVEVRIERGAESMEKRQGPDAGVLGCAGARTAHRSAYGPHEDPQDASRDVRIVLKEGPEAFWNRQHPLTHR